MRTGEEKSDKLLPLLAEIFDRLTVGAATLHLCVMSSVFLGFFCFFHMTPAGAGKLMVE